jgi:hypothetical protein
VATFWWLVMLLNALNTGSACDTALHLMVLRVESRTVLPADACVCHRCKEHQRWRRRLAPSWLGCCVFLPFDGGEHMVQHGLYLLRYLSIDYSLDVMQKS